MSQPTSNPIADQSAGSSASDTTAGTSAGCRSSLAIYAECPLCGSELFAEHAHFKCRGCGWRDSCCD